MRLLKNLAKLRRSRGLSQAEVADLIGTSTGAIGHWEQGHCAPTAENMRRLCDAFKVSPAYLWGLAGARATTTEVLAPLRRVA